MSALYRIASDTGTTLLALDDTRRDVALSLPPSFSPRPVVGDRVLADENLRVLSIEERRGVLCRARSNGTPQIIAANLDVVMVVTAPGRDYSLARVERYLVAIHDSNAQPLIVLNKRDTCENESELLEELEAVSAGAPVVAVSAVTDDVESVLTPFLWEGATIALVGSSGVGKSTLANRLLHFDRFRTGEVRADDGRGRHTSTSRDLVVLPCGAFLIDNPGMRSFAPWADDEALDDVFHEVAEAAKACHFRDCTHGDEPGCAVRGQVPSARLKRYRKLRSQMEYIEQRDDWEAAEEKRLRWREISKNNKRRSRN